MSDLEAELREVENDINCRSEDVGRLKIEYTRNRNKIMESYFPRMEPLTTAIYMAGEEQSALQLRISWLEQKAVAMEQHKSHFFELRDMAATRKTALDQALPGLQEAFLALEAIPKHELAVLRGYESPPQLVLDVFEAVHAVRGDEDRSWDGTKVLLSETYFYAFFISKVRHRHKYELGTEAMVALEGFLMKPESTVARAALVSAPCAALAMWLRALRNYVVLEDVTKPREGSLEDVKEELLALKRRLQASKEEVAAAEEKLELLRNEMGAQLEELRERYDETLVPLQQLFFEANQRFNDVYRSPQRRREESDHGP